MKFLLVVEPDTQAAGTKVAELLSQEFPGSEVRMSSYESCLEILRNGDGSRVSALLDLRELDNGNFPLLCDEVIRFFPGIAVVHIARNVREGPCVQHLCEHGETGQKMLLVSRKPDRWPINVAAETAAFLRSFQQAESAPELAEDVVPVLAGAE